MSVKQAWRARYSSVCRETCELGSAVRGVIPVQIDDVPSALAKISNGGIWQHLAQTQKLRITVNFENAEYRLCSLCSPSGLAMVERLGDAAIDRCGAQSWKQ